MTSTTHPKKKATVRMTVEYEIDVPANYDKRMVEFHRNEGTWCSNHAIEELRALAGAGGCLCGQMKFECIKI